MLAESLRLQEAECRVGREEHATVLTAEIHTRQRELQSAELAVGKLREVWRSSLEALRGGLLSLEERSSTGRREVSAGRLGGGGIQHGNWVYTCNMYVHVQWVLVYIVYLCGNTCALPQAEVLQSQVSRHSAFLDILSSSLQDLQLTTVGMIHNETNQVTSSS